ncbi:MAG: hypothetical protein NUK54_11090 [Methanothrix sp.]|nr:hypothetical protein [Methanothrix sp.]
MDLVILASAHNPSIMSPEWIEKNKLLDEKYINYVNTPQFSVFESETYNITIDQQRLQISLKNLRSDQKSLAKIGAKYLELLPHIPYSALGLNFIWSAQIAPGETMPEFNININDLNISNNFQDYELELGCIVKAKKDRYLLNLSIKPSGENKLIFNFNYHFDVEPLTVTKAIEYISGLPELCDDSYHIVNKILSGGS